jgi:RNA polymerase sigma-70 factor (ECF subfamily)
MLPETQYSTDSDFLLKRFHSGDLLAMQTLYDLHYKAIWYFANRLLRDAEQAEDIVAESFVKCWVRREKFDSLKGIAAFLFLVTRNACYGHLRNTRRRAASHKEISYLSKVSEDDVHTQLVRAEMMRQVLLEAESLPPKMKQVFKMLYSEGLTLMEIAAQLGLSVNTIIAHRAMAIRKVRESLTRKGLAGIWLF